MVNSKQFIESLITYKVENLSKKVIKNVTKVSETTEFNCTRGPKTANILNQWVLAILDIHSEAERV